MTLMKRPQVIVGILAVTHLLLGILAVLSFEKIAFTSLWVSYSLISLFVSQGILIGVWTALGGKRTPLRVMLTVIGIVTCVRVMDSPYTLFLIILALSNQTTTMIVLLLPSRLLGLELNLPTKDKWQSPPFQFTIKDLLVWTTVLAVSLSAFHYMAKEFYYDFVSMNGFTEIANLAGVGIASIWVVFGKRWISLRVLALLLSIGFGMLMLTLTKSFLFWDSGFLLTIEAAWTIGSLAVVRWAGYQMTWHWRLRRA